MGASFSEAKAIADTIQVRFGYSISVDENIDRAGEYYIWLNADFGSEQDIAPYLPQGWHFSGWRMQEHRAWVALVEKLS